MRRKWPEQCHIRRPGCGLKREYTAIVRMPSGKEQILTICEHCLELLLAEDKVVDFEEAQDA